MQLEGKTKSQNLKKIGPFGKIWQKLQNIAKSGAFSGNSVVRGGRPNCLRGGGRVPLREVRSPFVRGRGSR